MFDIIKPQCYGARVGANSSTGLTIPNTSGHTAELPLCGFFVSTIYGLSSWAAVWGASARRFLVSGIVTHAVALFAFTIAKGGFSTPSMRTRP